MPLNGLLRRLFEETVRLNRSRTGSLDVSRAVCSTSFVKLSRVEMCVNFLSSSSLSNTGLGTRNLEQEGVDILQTSPKCSALDPKFTTGFALIGFD